MPNVIALLSDLLNRHDVDGIGGGLIVAAILGFLGWLLKIIKRRIKTGQFFATGSGNRNILGYVIGWLLIAVGGPILTYALGAFTDATIIPLLIVLAVTIPMIGWLDRYAGVRRALGGNGLYDSGVFALFAFLISGCLVLALDAVVIVSLHFVQFLTK